MPYDSYTFTVACRAISGAALHSLLLILCMGLLTAGFTTLDKNMAVGCVAIALGLGLCLTRAVRILEHLQRLLDVLGVPANGAPSAAAQSEDVLSGSQTLQSQAAPPPEPPERPIASRSPLYASRSPRPSLLASLVARFTIALFGITIGSTILQLSSNLLETTSHVLCFIGMLTSFFGLFLILGVVIFAVKGRL